MLPEMVIAVPTPDSQRYPDLRAWVATIDADLAAAADEVDGTLIDEMLRLSLRERLDRASATSRWIGNFRIASAR